MEAKAYLRYLRISPRKVRLVVDQIRGLPLHKAEARLKFIYKASSGTLLKLLKSAKNNALQRGLKEENLFIKEIRVDEGRKLKRYMPRARGRATTIRKKSSHITLVLAEK